MRGEHREPDSMPSYISSEQRIPKAHPLRMIRSVVDEVLADMSREFDRLYASTGRPSTPPERLLRAQLLQNFYSSRSELLLLEQLNYNLLFRWFVGQRLRRSSNGPAGDVGSDTAVPSQSGVRRLSICTISPLR